MRLFTKTILILCFSSMAVACVEMMPPDSEHNVESGLAVGGADQPTTHEIQLLTCVDYKTCQERTIYVSHCPPVPIERCNGIDDNCDDQVDEDFECRMGDMVTQECSTPSGLETFACNRLCEWESTH